ncbi:possible precorrin-6X reductase [Prochlorococcus marinus str. MIT 9515]|uniref:Possible precorrin-6X reductase n=1 Tax=Prochlorococcus marinus (strain MIT 9515) TaxID=167542 RepID=A2BVG5_PROM5|nr:precorrin-6A/cobalt-precorrin-6A reductase [Prochlorococcus marinus]ABM71776.1 possible precorrin-6X reductase [Prochlorococcus marinus str. MIT 9515]
MHNSENCHENVWILSGTSDGPAIVNKLLKLDYVVFVSVVTHKASMSYSENSKLHIITGKLNDSREIIDFIEKNKINYVIDATHPFALIISKNLNEACKKIKKPLLAFERKSEIKHSKNFNYINGLKDIKRQGLVNKNILLAIGSRLLNDTASYYLECGANVFTRVIPTYESISKAFASCIKNSNIAILEPSKKKGNILEKKLCDHWDIDYILCRDSGSYAQMNWEAIVYGSDINLFLVKRPKLKFKNPLLFFDYDELINQITKN